MRSIGEAIATFFLSQWRFFKEERALRNLYPAFRKYDLTLKQNNPYQISRAFLEKKGEGEVHVYGETPLTTYDLIAQECALKASDHFVDLGCGRGRGVFFLSQRYGCHTVGVEWIAEFVERAKQINDSSRVQFVCADMFQVDISQATVIYLYGTCLNEEQIERLKERFKCLQQGSKVITVSYPLESADFTLQKQFTACYPWGDTDIYIQIKR